MFPSSSSSFSFFFARDDQFQSKKEKSPAFVPPSGIFSLRQKKGMGKSVNEKQHGSPFEGKGYSREKREILRLIEGRNDKIAPSSGSKIGSNRVTSNFYRRKNRLVFVGGSKDRRIGASKKNWEREREKGKKENPARTTAPTGSERRKTTVRTRRRRREEKRREIPPTSTTTVAVRVLVIVHGWPLE